LEESAALKISRNGLSTGCGARHAIGCAFVLLCVFQLSPAVAQPALPGIVSPIPPLRPPQLPRVGPGLPNVPEAQPNSAPGAGSTHAIQNLSVGGSTVYSPDELAPLTQGLTGAAVPQDKIESARAAIVELYRRDGYVFTSVNAIIVGGQLRLIINEGHISDVKLDGDIGPAGTQVLRFLNHLLQIRPVTVADLERWLLLASDVPGVSVRSVLNPTDTPGELTLVAQVTRKQVSGLFTADNRAFNLTGPDEGLAVVDFNSFTEFGEKTEISLYHTFNDTQTFGQAASEFFIGGSGLKGRIYGGAGDATPTGVLRAIGYNGSTNVFGASLTYPVIRSRQQNLNIGAYFDGLDSTIDTNTGANGAKTTASFDSLRVLSFGADYTLFDNLLGNSFNATNNATFRVAQGLPIFGASANGSQTAPRTGQQVDFTKVNGQFGRNQQLFQPWEGSSVALQGTVIGQATGNVLPPEEKYYLGGPHFNRGYYYGQVTGDNALVISGEIQLNTPLPSPPGLGLDFSAQFYGFYDWGQTWENQKTDPNVTLRSAGGGVRLYLTEFVEVDLEGVHRFTLYPNGQGPQVKGLGPTAFYWQFLGRF
jgi:hemolysin activation/secretion protein